MQAMGVEATGSFELAGKADKAKKVSQKWPMSEKAQRLRKKLPRRRNLRNPSQKDHLALNSQEQKKKL